MFIYKLLSDKSYMCNQKHFNSKQTKYFLNSIGDDVKAKITLDKVCNGMEVDFIWVKKMVDNFSEKSNAKFIANDYIIKKNAPKNHMLSLLWNKDSSESPENGYFGMISFDKKLTVFDKVVNYFLGKF
jgi:hypothetical protein